MECAGTTGRRDGLRAVGGNPAGVPMWAVTKVLQAKGAKFGSRGHTKLRKYL
jgi:hypothetical protein